ncbi:hypothetical protein [Salinispora arenicola]|uniref:hypothetical protein n=1 Tax=Salinispora arenicola TaxID=168697 RepID=UPI0027DD0302|nr:hypothetical protein [Salinispora arenicola]
METTRQRWASLLHRGVALEIQEELHEALTSGLCCCRVVGSGLFVATTAQDSGASQSPSSPAPTAGATSTSSGAGTGFRIDVWADNWSAVYIDGEQIGEDSVPITTERSFNAETYTFDAQMPFTVSIEAMDFKETDSGIEYIGEPNQQMGDGGIIAQITDLATGEVVAATDADWKSVGRPATAIEY